MLSSPVVLLMSLKRITPITFKLSMNTSFTQIIPITFKQQISRMSTRLLRLAVSLYFSFFVYLLTLWTIKGLVANSFAPVSLASTSSDSVVNPYASFPLKFPNSVEGVSDALEIEDGEEIEDAEGVVSDDDRTTNRTYFIGCQTVYSHSFNASGVKVRGSGNNSTHCMSCSL